ncbi:motility protein A [Acutalibacter sp. 1XD8-36]|uniref:motility protein A n=1 Tax=Acutalibacter sp. 1XD8-36 TaxID=2320852 RepID=UPI0014121AF0|nr:motility protein A [Acutalibacter sp. 1XD8-36]NBJ90273.1 motility protein A [Acutalibacter sp. 1XD8-36]
MNIAYLIGLVVAIIVMVLGMANGFPPYEFGKLGNFVDGPSVMIVIGCSVAIVLASFPLKTFLSIPKHFAVMLKNPKQKPETIIDALVDLAQIARKDGLLALEEKAGEQEDPFFKQAIMLIVDANDPDRVRATLENDIECMSDRHNAAAALYDKASAVSPAFGMVGTLIGLINMLKNMDPTSSDSNIGADMSVALVTTLYGCILAHMVFGPVANNLRIRDSEEVLNKMIIVEGITCIQAGENPKMLREKLLTFVAQKQREKLANSAGGSGEA